MHIIYLQLVYLVTSKENVHIEMMGKCIGCLVRGIEFKISYLIEYAIWIRTYEVCSKSVVNFRFNQQLFTNSSTLFVGPLKI